MNNARSASAVGAEKAQLHGHFMEKTIIRRRFIGIPFTFALWRE